MVPARLASSCSKQQAAASKQLAPQVPFRAPEQPGSGNQEKNVTILSGMVFRNFLRNKFFFWTDPHVVGNGDLLGFWPILGLGHSEKSRAWAENRKPQFPGARSTFVGEVRPPQHCAIFLRFGRPDSTGGKLQNTGFLGPFGL